VKKYIKIAKKIYKDTKRPSGELLFDNSLRIAKRCKKIANDKTLFLAALFNNSIKYNLTTLKYIKRITNKDVVTLLTELDKIESITKNLGSEKITVILTNQLILASTKDIRTLIIKIVDNIEELDTLSVLEKSEREDILTKTEKIYIPMTDLLGMHALKKELDDKFFKIKHPNKYEEISSFVSNSFPDTTVSKIEKLLKDPKNEFI